MFLKKRVKRIAPVYLMCLIIDIILTGLMNGFDNAGISLITVISNIFGVQQLYSIGYNYIWYITLLVVTYLLASTFKSIADRLNIYQIILTIALLCVISISFWNSYNYMILVTRIPIFFIGIVFGRVSGKLTLDKKKWIIAIVLLAISLVSMYMMIKYVSVDILWNKGMYWYPYIVIAPLMCFTLAVIFEKVKVFPILNWFGKRSFEIFLVQVTVIRVWEHYKYINGIESRNLYWLIIFVGIIVTSELLYNLINNVLNKCLNCKTNY